MTSRQGFSVNALDEFASIREICRLPAHVDELFSGRNEVARRRIYLIKGRPVGEAIAILEHLNKGSSLQIGRVVRSAIANAENNFNMTMENLYVKKALADEGPRMKRVWYRGRGRRDMKLKRTSHITIVVDERWAGS